jgi:uncharacterized protein (TIGR02996 family)
MTPDQAFLQAIRETPADDAPRLIYADWLEEHDQPDRAEFIRMQCSLDSMPAEEPRRADLRQRAAELLQQHWKDWVGPLHELVGPQASRRGEAWLASGFHPEYLKYFRRGFVDSLSLSVEAFLDRAAILASLVPLRHLRLWGAGRRAAELAASPLLAGIEMLNFIDYFDSPLTADGAVALAASPHLGRLISLDLYKNNIGDRGAEALTRAPWFRQLRALNLSDSGLSPAGVRAVMAARPPLAVLQLGDNGVEPTAVQPMGDPTGKDSTGYLSRLANEAHRRGLLR